MPRLIAAAYENNWISAVGALTGVLKALGGSFSQPEVSALSGHAFRIAVTSTPDGEIGPDGPNCFATTTAFPLYENLGWRFEAIEAAAPDRHFAKRRDEALKRIHRSVDKGRPAIAFGLHLPEFGIVRGYDRENLIASTTVSTQYGERIPLGQWPSPGEPQPLRVFVPEKHLNAGRDLALHRVLHFAVDYARSGERTALTLSVLAATGLAAFERWISVLESDATISPHGQSYCIQALQSARSDAATFLRTEAKSRPHAEVFLGAAAAYGAVVLELSRMATLFPYPNGGDVVSTGSRRAGAAHLRRALNAELQAISALELATSSG